MPAPRSMEALLKNHEKRLEQVESRRTYLPNPNPTFDSITVNGDVHVAQAAGLMMVFTGTTPPTGWLVCDGRAISRTVYPELFFAIGTTYGSGDGSTTFNIPDTRGRTLVGFDSSQTEFDVLGETGGEKSHTLTADELALHGHEFGGDDGIGTQGGYAVRSNFAYDATSTSTGGGANYATKNMFAGSNNTGAAITGGQAHNNLQPYITVQMIISTGRGLLGLLPPYDALTVEDLTVGNTIEVATLLSVGGLKRITATSAAQRDQIISSPAQGDRCFRTDCGWEEEYFELYDPSANPAGALVAGWYPVSGKLPKARVYFADTGVGGIGTAVYCADSVYLQTPAQNALWKIAWDGTTGKLTPAVLGKYRAKWHVIQAPESAASLILAVSFNSTTNPSSPGVGTPYAVNGAFGAVELPANPSYYTWNESSTNEMDTQALTDYFQFWFGAGSGTTAIQNFTYFTKHSYVELEYVGPSRKMY